MKRTLLHNRLARPSTTSARTSDIATSLVPKRSSCGATAVLDLSRLVPPSLQLHVCALFFPAC